MWKQCSIEDFNRSHTAYFWTLEGNLRTWRKLQLPQSESNPGPSCCEVKKKKLTTDPLCPHLKVSWSTSKVVNFMVGADTPAHPASSADHSVTRMNGTSLKALFSASAWLMDKFPPLIHVRRGKHMKTGQHRHQ